MTIPKAVPDITPAKPAGYASRVRTHFAGLEGNALGVAYVSAGTFGLVIMAAIAKHLGDRLPSFELLFFRSAIGFLFVLPTLRGNWREPFQTKRFGMHMVRGAVGAGGNFCFFISVFSAVGGGRRFWQ